MASAILKVLRDSPDSTVQESILRVKIRPYILMLVLATLALAGDSKKAQREYEQGLRQEQAGHWQEAYDAFSASLDARP